MYAKGRHRRGGTRGVQQGLAKLTDEKVRTIRQKFLTGRHTIWDLAIEYNMAFASIRAVIHCKTWKHVATEIEDYHERIATITKRHIAEGYRKR